MAAIRILAAGVCCVAVFAQQPQTAPEQPPAGTPQFRTSVEVVSAPVTVLDQDGNFINGLQPYDFHLYDNDKEQNIKVDVSYQPISLVIAIQANGHVDSILPQIRRIGPLVEPLVIGDQGEAAVLAFDHRLRLMQDFTNDGTKITDAIKKIQAGSNTSRMIDAVGDAVRMLRSRPPNRRRIVLLVSETRDMGSEGSMREDLIDAQLFNVTVYTVDISRFVTTLMAGPGYPRVDNRPPAAHPLPSGVPATPTTVMQTYGTQGGSAQFVPMMVEIFKDVKAVFRDNPAEFFTKGTGGREFSFARQRGLEEAIQKVGDELHSQYIVSYHPNNLEEGGFHEIKVAVASRPDARVRTRPGYWLGPK